MDNIPKYITLVFKTISLRFNNEQVFSKKYLKLCYSI